MTIPAPTNPAYVIDDGLTLHAPAGGGEQTQYGLVAGAPYIFAFGTDPWFGMAVFEGSVLDVAAGQTYHLYIEGNAEADFSGATQELGNWAMGVMNPQDIIALSNMYNETVYPYGRLKIVMTGAAPKIKLKAFIRSLLEEPPQDLSDKISTDIVLSQNIQNAVTNLLGWMAGPAFGGPAHDGRYAIADGTGNTVYRYSPDQIAANGSLLTPENFGAIGDGLSHPASGTFATLADCQAVYPFATSLAQELDFLAWQKAINTGKRIGSPPNDYVMCNTDPASHTTLVFTAGLAWVDATRPRWDFTRLVAVTTDTHFVPDYDFATAGSWENATIWASDEFIPATFDTGAAVMTDTGAFDPETGLPTQKTFYQWGQLLTLAAGRYTVTCVVEATKGDSYALGNVNPPYCNIGFSSTSPGEGANPVGRSGGGRFNVFLPGGVPDVQTFTFDFNVPGAGSAWLTFSAGGYGNFRVTKLDITPSLLNCAVLMTRDDAPSYYPIMQPLKGVWIYGPATSSGVTGVLWKSFVHTDGNVPSLEMTNVTGFEYGMESSDGAYLMEIKSCNSFGNRVGYRHRGGVNAGENIRITGGGIFNNDIAIDNSGGGEINIIHTAIDYNGQAIVNNAGTINLSLLRVEQWCDASHPSPIFHCLPGGKITCSQIRFLGAGSPGTALVPPVQLDSGLSSMTMHMCDVYNLSSASGYAKSGPGRLRITDMQNIGNPNIGMFMLSDSPAEDVLGGAGFFEPTSTLVPVSADGIHLEGGLYPEGTHTSIDRWNSDITTIEVTTAYAFQGTRSLKITKASSADLSINDVLHILIPTRGGNLLGGFKLLMPHDQATTGIIYYRVYWVRVIGQDDLGRPVYGPNEVFKGETDIPVPLLGSPTWITRSFGTLYENDSTAATTQAGIRPPVWATHLRLAFDHQSNPAMTYYIDAIHANEVG